MGWVVVVVVMTVVGGVVVVMSLNLTHMLWTQIAGYGYRPSQSLSVMQPTGGGGVTEEQGAEDCTRDELTILEEEARADE